MRLPLELRQRIHQGEGGLGARRGIGRAMQLAGRRRRPFRKSFLDRFEQEARSTHHRHVDGGDIAADAAAGGDDVRGRDRFSRRGGRVA